MIFRATGVASATPIEAHDGLGLHGLGLLLLASSILTGMVAVGGAGCGGATAPVADGTEAESQPVAETSRPREEPPASGPARDIAFPPIQRFQMESGLEVRLVERRQLPVVYARLVFFSGSETDPEHLPGLSNLVAQMLEEGTRSKSSAELAEEIEYLGADMQSGSDEESLYVGVQGLSEHFETMIELLAEIVTQPAFEEDELAKLKRRELDRLKLMSARPNYLARRILYQRLYGTHPYGHVDTNTEVLRRLAREDLVTWHEAHIAPNNATLVVVGDVDRARVERNVGQVFELWQPTSVPQTQYPQTPQRTERELVVVDRPGSVQTTIMIANLAVERGHEDWVPLMVSNQVLGGSAASRLFMDLREERGLTYGAYSNIAERVKVGPFLAYAQVETSKTFEAVGAFFEHLERITTEAVPEEELERAAQYLSNSFPLEIDTPAKIASMVSDLRVFELPDGYWDGFRSSIASVMTEEALAAAQAHIHPRQSLVLLVGDAGRIAEPLRRFGEVQVVNADDEVLQTLPPLAIP
ncbi:MAG: pitrilysin family protein [Myxococcota bacterium]